jgi:GNAT superfamily N-acetyltransferase
MEIIEYYSSNNKEYWLSKINECDWVAGKFLYELIKQDKLKELVGDDVKVLLLTNELDLISFCTLSKVDDIPTTELTPWIGFVYTFPEYRGHRHMGKLISYAEEIVKSNGFSNIYISTNQEGIYEKYGFNFMGIMKDMDNEDSRVYIKTL